MIATEIGIKLRRARVDAALTQAQLAGLIGTTQSAVARAESGLSVCTLELIDRIAGATRQSIELVFPIETPPRRKSSVRFDPWERNPTVSEARILRKRAASKTRAVRKRSTSK